MLEFAYEGYFDLTAMVDSINFCYKTKKNWGIVDIVFIHEVTNNLYTIIYDILIVDSGLPVWRSTLPELIIVRSFVVVVIEWIQKGLSNHMKVIYIIAQVLYTKNFIWVPSCKTIFLWE